jgi:hypothetical protein
VRVRVWTGSSRGSVNGSYSIASVAMEESHKKGCHAGMA